MKVSDLVQIPPVRTVVRLADLYDHTLRRGMVEDFILTDEAVFALQNVMNKIALLKGQGFFVIGNYGSGKSHLLNMISLLLADGEARSIFRESCLESDYGNRELPELAEGGAAVSPLTVEISLVEHGSRERLETIVLSAAESKLRPGEAETAGLHPGWLEMPRSEAFNALREALKKSGRGGMVILLDELSEFLRSKPHARGYNEDVRFLQYLGEFAEAIPAWIVATLQENIENTGSITGEMLHKIKDRYPVRFRLTGRHVKEIASRRLVRKKKNADAAVAQIFEDYRHAFATLPFSRDDFVALYPVHPSTVEFLDELRPLFSQHRGVVDFIHYQLAGDSARGIEPFMENPAHSLLTPDRIFDHFRDRIRETAETNPYSEQVFRYFEREIGNIFPDQEDAAMALRLLKILILGALAPGGRRFGAADLAGMLLYRFTELESGVNYDYISDILEKLLQHGAYVAAEEKTDPQKGAPQKLYHIDLRTDAAVLVKKKLQQILYTVPPGDERVAAGLLPWLEEPYLPLGELHKNRDHEKEVFWQGTRRKGRLLFCPVEDFTAARLGPIQEELEAGEMDFAFFIFEPALGEKETEKNVSTVLQWKAGNIIPSLLLWLPRQPDSSEESELRRAFSYHLLHEEYAHDSSAVGLQVKEHLQGILEEQKRKVKEIAAALYYQGRIKVGGSEINPSSLGYIPFDELLRQLAAEALKERYPRHFEIRPKGEVSGSFLQKALQFISSPRAEEEQPDRSDLIAIENFLMPLGVVKKKGRAYFLEINPRKSPLVAEFMAHIPEEGRVSLTELYRRLRKGPFGLSREGFQALGLAVIFSGAVSAYQGGKRISPPQVSYYRFWNIEELGPGTLVSAELQKVLQEIPFLPAQLRSSPLTFAAQQAAWDAVIAFKTEQDKKLHEIKAHLGGLSGHRFFDASCEEKIENIAARAADFLKEIKVSYSSQEGLERFLAAFQARPLLQGDLAKIEGLYRFLQSDLERLLRLGLYLTDPGLVIPEGDKYERLRKQHQMLLEMLAEEEIFYEEKFRERLFREFKTFQDEYISLYLREHDAERGAERLVPYQSLSRSAPYQLLENFGRIGALVVTNDIVSINRVLSGIYSHRCSSADKILLKERPCCVCGFKLGQKLEAPMPSELEAKMHSSIRDYLSALQEEENSERLQKYLQGMEMLGRRHDTALLGKLLNVDPQKTGVVEELSRWLNRAVINHINQALTGDAVIAERCVDELQEILAGRVFTAQQMEELFRRWLCGEDDAPPRYIRVLDRKGNSAAAGKVETGAGTETGKEMSNWAAELLGEKYPELLSLAVNAGEKELLMLSLVLGWLNYQQVISESAQNKAGSLLNLGRLRLEEYQKLASLGEMLIEEKDTREQELLEQLCRCVENTVNPTQLWELYLHSGRGGAGFHSFDFTLQKILDEPLFPGVVDELGRRLASQLQAGETEQSLKSMQNSLREAARTFQGKGAGKGPLEELLLQQKKKTLLMLDRAALCLGIIAGLNKAGRNPLSGDRAWENLYRSISPFEMEFELLKKESRFLEDTLGISLDNWFRSYIEAINNAEAAFYSYCAGEMPPGRQTLAELLSRFLKWAEKKEHGGAYLLILDGARLDIWEFMMENMLSETKLHFLREGFTWALIPTVTEVQLQPLKESGILGHIVNVNDGILAEFMADPHSLLQAVDNRPCIGSGEHGGHKSAPLRALKFNFVDEKVHVSGDNIITFGEEILIQARKKLWPVLKALPGNSLLLITSDHGFRTNRGYKGQKPGDMPRYLHGNCTIFEVLAPWVLLEKKS